MSVTIWLFQQTSLYVAIVKGLNKTREQTVYIISFRGHGSFAWWMHCARNDKAVTVSFGGLG